MVFHFEKPLHLWIFSVVLYDLFKRWFHTIYWIWWLLNTRYLRHHRQYLFLALLSVCLSIFSSPESAEFCACLSVLCAWVVGWVSVTNYKHLGHQSFQVVINHLSCCESLILLSISWANCSLFGRGNRYLSWFSVISKGFRENQFLELNLSFT